jgi:hypothetical protein
MFTITYNILIERKKERYAFFQLQSAQPRVTTNRMAVWPAGSFWLKV